MEHTASVGTTVKKKLHTGTKEKCPGDVGQVPCRGCTSNTKPQEDPQYSVSLAVLRRKLVANEHLQKIPDHPRRATAVKVVATSGATQLIH
jgi:hypothetical protein